jgi:hypothetical protein
MKNRKSRKLIALAATFAMVWSTLGATAAPEREVAGQGVAGQAVEETRDIFDVFVPAPDLCPEIAELQSIVMDLARSERMSGTARAVDFRCAESVQQRFDFAPADDSRTNLMAAFQATLLSAERQSGRNYVEEPILVTAYSEISGEIVLGFSDERYFAFVDFIADFTGLDRDMFTMEVVSPTIIEPIGICEPDCFLCGLDDVSLEHEVANSQPQVLPMGTFVNIHWSYRGIGRNIPATLGHPINSTAAGNFIWGNSSFGLFGRAANYIL